MSSSSPPYLLIELDLLLQELLVHQLHVLEPLAVEGVDLGEEGVRQRVRPLPDLRHLRLPHLALRLHTLELFPLPHSALVVETNKVGKLTWSTYNADRFYGHQIYCVVEFGVRSIIKWFRPRFRPNI